jgi:hypothetical protein
VIPSASCDARVTEFRVWWQGSWLECGQAFTGWKRIFQCHGTINGGTISEEEEEESMVAQSVKKRRRRRRRRRRRSGNSSPQTMPLDHTHAWFQPSSNMRVS